MSTLEIRDLQVSVGSTQILNGITLTINSGEVHAVMGPNGAGKSTLSAAIMGKPGYEVTGGSVTLDGQDVLAMPTWQRAVAGLHLVMQYPTEVPGVKLSEVLSEALVARHATLPNLNKTINEEAARISFDSELVNRAVNVDFSGGEKKRNENKARAATVAPPMIMIRTSCLAMNLAIGMPETPPTRKKNVVANEIDETDHPSSRLNACR